MIYFIGVKLKKAVKHSELYAISKLKSCSSFDGPAPLKSLKRLKF